MSGQSREVVCSDNVSAALRQMLLCLDWQGRCRQDQVRGPFKTEGGYALIHLLTVCIAGWSVASLGFLMYSHSGFCLQAIVGKYNMKDADLEGESCSGFHSCMHTESGVWTCWSAQACCRTYQMEACCLKRHRGIAKEFCSNCFCIASLVLTTMSKRFLEMMSSYNQHGTLGTHFCVRTAILHCVHTSFVMLTMWSTSSLRQLSARCGQGHRSLLCKSSDFHC